jgi:hypothetical protein
MTPVPPKMAGLGITWKNSPCAAHFFIPCRLSELSVPWNREQTDSLTQGITEARPRYQNEEWAPLWGPFSFGNEQCLNLRGSSSSRGAPMRSIGIKAPRPTEPRRGEGHPAPATRKPKTRPRAGFFVLAHRTLGIPLRPNVKIRMCIDLSNLVVFFVTKQLR